MKKIIKYIIFALVIISLILGFTGLLSKISNPHINNDSDNNNEKAKNEVKNEAIEKVVVTSSENTTTYKYKHYEYEIPNNITFDPYKLSFKLKDDSENGWEAEVSLYYDENKEIFEKKDLIKDELIYNGYNVDEQIDELIGNNNYIVVLATKTNNDNIEYHVISYLQSETKYVYEINLVNKKGDYNQDAIDIIDKILMNGKNDHSDEIYSYYKFEFQN